MREHNESVPDHYDPPTNKQLVEGAFGAFLVAAVVLVAFVMPAEYGIDPIGTGTLFGLNGLAEDDEAGSVSEASMAPVTEDGFQADAITFSLRPGEGREYKLEMAEGSVLLYEWATDTGGRLFYDFHGDQEGAGDAFTSHKEGTGSDDAGTLEIPFDGRHGWYWSNPGPATVEVTLRTAGDYQIIGFV